MFMFSPVCDYAGAVEACAEVASGSDAEVKQNTLGTQESDEPFYYDENGNKVYDSEIDFPGIYDDYEDIMWTFEKYPNTMMASDTVSTYVVGIDDIVVIGIVLIACAACGYCIAWSDIPEFISNGFEPWLRRNKGADSSVMEMWQSLLSTGLGASFVGMRLLVENIKEYLGLSTSDDASINIPASSLLRDTPFFDKTPSSQFVGSATSFVSNGAVRYYDICSGYPLAGRPNQCAYLVPVNASDTYYLEFAYPNMASTAGYNSWKGTVYYNNYLSGGYFEYSEPKTASTTSGGYSASLFKYLKIPVFIHKQAAVSHLLYGTMGGIFNLQADDFLTAGLTNQWSDLQQGLLEKYTYSNVLNVPATQEEFDALINAMSQSQTGSDVIDALKPAWDITTNDGGIVSMTSYLHLSYVLDAVSVYAGAGTLSADVRNGFLKDYLNITSAGGTIEQLNIWAQTVVNSQVTITGKDEDNDKNSFIITAALVAALLEYLYAQNLLEAIPDIAAGTQVRANVRVADKAVTPPDGGGSADLSGILSIISSILAAIGGLPALIATEAIKALASSAFANGITLNLDSIRTGIRQIAQWDFADWASALGAAVLLALRTAASDFGLDGVSGALDRIAGWDFSDWSVALGASVLAALKSAGADFGLDGVSGALDRIAKWNFADWANVLKGALDTALAGLGIGVIADHLADIAAKIASGSWSVDLSELKDWIAALPAAIAASFADAIEAEEEAAQEYQLSSIISDKFPFCIPFDLISCVTVLQAEPLEPRWELPFVVETEHIHIQESIVLDLSTEQWARPVAVIRSMLLLFYIVGLVILTRLLIKG